MRTLICGCAGYGQTNDDEEFDDVVVANTDGGYLDVEDDTTYEQTYGSNAHGMEDDDEKEEEEVEEEEDEDEEEEEEEEEEVEEEEEEDEEEENNDDDDGEDDL
jgi:hypothetical protein